MISCKKIRIYNSYHFDFYEEKEIQGTNIQR
jgi:hypothetical protein